MHKRLYVICRRCRKLINKFRPGCCVGPAGRQAQKAGCDSTCEVVVGRHARELARRAERECSRGEAPRSGEGRGEQGGRIECGVLQTLYDVPSSASGCCKKPFLDLLTAARSVMDTFIYGFSGFFG